MAGASTRVWVWLGVLSLGDIAWCAARDIAIADWLPFAMGSAALAAIALLAYRRGSGRWLRLAAFVEWSLLWLIFSVAGALLTYLAAARGGALYDAPLAAADAAIGFDWAAWSAFVAAHPPLGAALTLFYKSLFPQALFAACWFSGRGRECRNAELLTNAILALLLTTAVFCLYPSFGPCAGLPASCHDAYLDDLVGLRSGNLPSLDIMVLKGVIAFPSFHAVLATLFVYAHRAQPTFLPVAAFNAGMLLSLPSEGGHYLVDVAGGLCVGLIVLLATRVLPRARQRALAPAGTG